MLTTTPTPLSTPPLDEQLTTGETAQLLGATRQHIVNLCNRGELPYTLVGAHRRIRRHDIDDYAGTRARMTADQIRSLLLAYAVAAHIAADPDAARDLARNYIQRSMLERTARGSARSLLVEWAHLIEGPLPDLLMALTSPSRHSRDLRQVSPFAGILSDKERRDVLETARRVTRPGRPRSTPLNDKPGESTTT